MHRFLLPLALLLAAAGTAAAQEGTIAGRCATPDSIAFQGNTRVSAATLRSEAGLPVGGSPLGYRDLERAIRNLYAIGQFEDVRSSCVVGSAGTGATLVFTVVERPLLSSVDVTGVDRLSAGTVRDQVDLLVGRPLDPAAVARAVQKIDSLYEKAGYYLARVHPDSSKGPDGIKLTFRVEEGRRLAVSGVQVHGNQKVSAGDIVGAMETKPEGFLFMQKGEFDEDTWVGDLSERIPKLYASRGFIDARVERDTVIIDRELGKALLDLTVHEGPQYRVGSFEVQGAKLFNSEAVASFYPFGDRPKGIRETLTDIFKRDPSGGEIFDASAWEEATGKVSETYANEGYIYARVNPVVERTVAADSTPVVNLRWEIDEAQPAIVNKVEIAGNEITTESCIREQIWVIPGDVFKRDLLIRSYQNISNLGFFESPLPPPDTKPSNENGDVDIIFHVKEKRTGTVNFGASVGQGTGVGGFIGFEQPNLFGLCKKGSLQWQFGRYMNDFNLAYTDPAIKQSRISGTVNAYHSMSRFTIADVGRVVRTGGQVQVGFPVPASRFSRFALSYGGEAVKYGQGGFFGTLPVRDGFRSTLGATFDHDTRVDMPFPSAGASQSVSAQFNGGPLGGSASFQRYTGEMRSFSTLGQVGGGSPGSQPIKFVAGLTARAGALFGDAGPFYLQRFSLGGVQFGEPLRGYPEFSITPNGFVGGDNLQAQLSSFGNAFFTTTAEVGIRFNQQLYLNAFYDAGNIWERAREFDPTRLFRGAGVGASVVTPLGPLGLDFGYGFDRRDPLTGKLAPKWELHFRLGQFFQ
jgi:outer membrane protein insertion porin family